MSGFFPDMLVDLLKEHVLTEASGHFDPAGGVYVSLRDTWTALYNKVQLFMVIQKSTYLQRKTDNTHAVPKLRQKWWFLIVNCIKIVI